MYTLFTQSIMQALTNFESSAVETLSLEPETGTVQVGFFSGDTLTMVYQREQLKS